MQMLCPVLQCLQMVSTIKVTLSIKANNSRMVVEMVKVSQKTEFR